MQRCLGSISSISLSEVRWSCSAGVPWSSQCGSSQAASRGRKFESFWERFCDIQTRFWGCVNFYESFREFFEMMANPILRELENSQFWGGREKLVQNLVTPTIFLILRRPDLWSAFSFLGLILRWNWSICSAGENPLFSHSPLCFRWSPDKFSGEQRSQAFRLEKQKSGKHTEWSDLLILGIKKRDSPLAKKYVVIDSLSIH